MFCRKNFHDKVYGIRKSSGCWEDSGAGIEESDRSTWADSHESLNRCFTMAFCFACFIEHRADIHVNLALLQSARSCGVYSFLSFVFSSNLSHSSSSLSLFLSLPSTRRLVSSSFLRFPLFPCLHRFFLPQSFMPYHFSLNFQYNSKIYRMHARVTKTDEFFKALTSFKYHNSFSVKELPNTEFYLLLTFNAHNKLLTLFKLLILHATVWVLH